MILDKENEYSDDQAVTTTEDSDNTVDHGPGSEGPNAVDSILRVQVSEADMAAGTDLQAILEEDDVIGMGSANDVIAGPVLALADLTVGAILLEARQLPIQKRFTQIRFVANGTFSGAGRITAGWVGGTQRGEPTG